MKPPMNPEAHRKAIRVEKELIITNYSVFAAVKRI